MALVEPTPARIKDLGGAIHTSIYSLGASFVSVLSFESRVFRTRVKDMNLQDPREEERNRPQLQSYADNRGIEYKYQSRCVVFDIKAHGMAGINRFLSFVCPDYLTGHVFISMRGLMLLSDEISVRPMRERYKAMLRVREWMEERIPCPSIGRVHGVYLGNLYSSSRYCPHVGDGLRYLVSQLHFLIGASGEELLNTDVLEYQLTARAAYTLWTVGKLLPMEYVLYSDSLWSRIAPSARHAVREERALVDPLIKTIERARDKRANATKPCIHDGAVFSRTSAGLDRMADVPLMAIV